jgi:3-oxoacyl-[acyl-carrier protein] reductase
MTQSWQAELRKYNIRVAWKSSEVSYPFTYRSRENRDERKGTILKLGSEDCTHYYFDCRNAAKDSSLK